MDSNVLCHNLFSVAQKTVVITGAGGQLGTALCSAFSSSNAHVIATDVTIEKKHPHAAQWHKMDITDKKQIQNVFQTIVKQHGAIDILVNNAGVSTFEPFEQRGEKSIDWVMDVNLKGMIFCIQSYIDAFDSYDGSQGVIINIASIYGIVSPDYRIYTDCLRKNSEIYGATKAGIIQMTRYYAVHLSPRAIRVNCVSPGGIYNPKSPQGDDFIKQYSLRCPLQRMATVNDITGSVLFLASNAASYITGHNLVIDGGMSCW